MKKDKYEIPMIEMYEFQECVVVTSSNFGDLDEGEF